MQDVRAICSQILIWSSEYKVPSQCPSEDGVITHLPAWDSEYVWHLSPGRWCRHWLSENPRRLSIERLCLLPISLKRWWHHISANMESKALRMPGFPLQHPWFSWHLSRPSLRSSGSADFLNGFHKTANQACPVCEHERLFILLKSQCR